MTQQLTLLDALCPPPALPPAPPIVERPSRLVMTRAFGLDHEIAMLVSDRDPVEMEVRGIPCLVARGSTYTLQPHGSLFWSDTGFRSFCWPIPDDGPFPEAGVRAAIEQHIDDADGKGRLVRWWPGYVHRWRDEEAFMLAQDRARLWRELGPERQADLLAQHDARQAEALARMAAHGIDPDEIGAPEYFTGDWPRFGARAAEVAA